MVKPLEKDVQYENSKIYTSLKMDIWKIIQKMDYGVNQAHNCKPMNIMFGLK
jgi:hypothetical protein